MAGARAIMSKPMVPVITPPTIQGRRMPRRERVRSLSLPKSGLATRAKIAPMPRMSERSPASPFASICAMRRGRATIIGVSSAIQVPKYAAMKTGPTRRVGAGASALTRSGLVAVIGNGFLGSSFTSSSLVGSCMDASPSEGVCHVAVLLIREQYERASGQLDTQGAGEADVPRGGTHVHHVIAMGYLPAVRVDVPRGQRTRGGIGV